MADVVLVGSTSLGSGWVAYDRVWLTKHTASISGTLKYLRVYCQNTPKFKVAVYSDSDGEPGPLLYASSEISGIGGWNNVPTSEINIVAGTPYWLCAIADSNNINIRVISGQITRYKNITYSSYTFPNPAGSGYSSTTVNRITVVGWGAVSGCPRRAMHMRRLM